MYIRIAIAVVVAALLAGSHWKAYVMGKDAVRVEWQAEKLAATEVSRLQERLWSKKLEDARNEATKRETAIRTDADRARKSADGLRDELATIREQLPNLAADAVRQRADTLAELFGACADEYQGMAEKADGHASDSLMLQDAWPR